LNTAEIYIDDGSRDLIENKGDGIKRSLTFALLQAYVQKQRERTADGVAQRPLLFLFEEPELYLHPRSQKVLFDTLAAISSTHQVIVTTHSPLFFAPGVTAGFTRVAKEASAHKPVGVLYPIDFALDRTSAEVFRLARFENADAAFFSSRVVLFEGQSDDCYLKHVARKLSLDWDFERKSIGLVRVDGKGNFSKYRRFFESFGMKVMIVLRPFRASTPGFKRLASPPHHLHLKYETGLIGIALENSMPMPRPGSAICIPQESSTMVPWRSSTHSFLGKASCHAALPAGRTQSARRR
jgi:predicted ATP-dependent endonuclease of OLD family